MTFRAPAATVVVATLVGAAPALRGQHAAGAAGADAAGCELCHASHVDAPSEFNLRIAATPVWAGGGRGGAVGATSQSCLRCHVSRTVRAEQPEFSARGLGLPIAPRGAYFGYDLTAHHPIGRIARSPLQDDPRLPDPWERARPQPRFRADAGALVLECTGCHDPHSRHGAAPLPEDEAVLCGTCHDPAAYEVDEHAGTPCSACHQVHGGARRSLLREPTVELVCAGCHAAGRGAAAAAARPMPPGHAGVSAGNARSCVACHAIHR